METRQRAVMFADVTGSTSLYEEIGDAQAHARIHGLLQRIEHETAAFGGVVVKRLGDGLMCAFPDASEAVRASRAMQLAAAETGVSSALAIHVGCHWGPVLEEEGDLYGDSVNVAARVASHARTGQILLTRELVDRADPSLRGDVRSLGHVLVKGRRQPLEIVEYVWDGSTELTMIRETVGAVASRLELAWAGGERAFEANRLAPITLGRDPASDVVVQDPAASRNHATIERRRDRFVLVDHSANGTFVAPAEQTEWCLQRQELVLRGTVRIALGRSTSDAHATVIDVRCE